MIMMVRRQVEAVTFKHVPQCDVIQLTLEGDAPNLCITARQRVARASKEKEVGTVGNSIIANGPCALMNHSKYLIIILIDTHVTCNDRGVLSKSKYLQCRSRT